MTGSNAAVSPPPLHIRSFEMQDYTAVVELWSRCFTDTFPNLSATLTPDLFSNRLQDAVHHNHRIWIATQQEEIRAFATAHQQIIRNLFVDPHHQRLGIGTQLIKKIKQELGTPVFVQTLSVHWQARAFYKKQGFQFFIQEPSGFEGHTQVILRWDSKSMLDASEIVDGN